MSQTTTELHRIQAENAHKIWGWLNTRGGVCIWGSADLCDPGKTWTCPYKDADGNIAGKQSWQMESQPNRHITDPAEIVVDEPKEVKRFHVAVRMGDSGLRIKCTSGSSNRIQKALRRASEAYYAERCKVEGPKPENEGLAWYQFDYFSQEAVIYVPGQTLSIAEFVKKYPENKGE